MFSSVRMFIGLISVAALGLLAGCGNSEQPAARTGTGTSSGSSSAVEFHGAGATFPAPLYATWTSEFNKLKPNVKVDYQAIGSGGGIKGITDRTVQFAGSDAPMTEEQLKAVPAPVLHLPTVAGPVVIVYNLPEVKTLTLDGPVLAEIFLGKIAKWNDAKIAALNAGANLPATDIVVAHRSDGSGTTWIFTNFLAKVSADWKSSVGNATAVKWPTGLGGKGNDGVAQSVQNAVGGIGYVELAFAQNAKLPYAKMVNKAGKTVEASIDGVEEAAKNSSEIPADMRISITDAPGDASYPICGYTYFLVYTDLTYLKNSEQESSVVDFIKWCVHDGQNLAKPAYAPLSAALQKKVDEAIATLKVDAK